MTRTSGARSGFSSALDASPFSGAIRPDGCLLSFSPDGSALLRYSENAPAFLGDPDLSFDQSAEACLGPAAFGQIARAAEEMRATGRPAVLFGVPVRGHLRRDVLVHATEHDLTLEFEPAASAHERECGLAELQTVCDRLRGKSDLHSFFSAVVREIRKLTGFDRVMLCRFDQEGMPEVVAEEKRPDLMSFQGHYLSAGKIPAVNAIKYRQTRVRIVHDVAAPPIKIFQKPALPSPDLSGATLRALTPEVQEYFLARGVRGSVVLSLFVDGELWGMIACRHYTPRTVAAGERTVLNILREIVSLRITALIRARRHDVTSRAHGLTTVFMHNALFRSDIVSCVRSELGTLMSLLDCDDIAAWVDGEWTGYIRPLSPGITAALVDVAGRRARDGIWMTEYLAGDEPEVARLLPETAGMMVIPISGRPRDYLFVVRRELVRVINNPSLLPGCDTPGSAAALLPHLTRIDGHSAPWTVEDEEAADQVRSALIEVMDAYREQMLQERARADTRQRILNEELSHRVKNILAVVQSLVSRPTSETVTAEEQLTALRGRIKALSTAHDQIARGGEGGSLHDLLGAELAPYRVHPGTVVLEGPDIWLPARAFSLMALLCHELATNAAKYGALSVPSGRVTVTWEQDDTGSWIILWTEEGGPPVRPSTRDGFGSVLLDRAVRHELGGEAVRDLRPEGAVIHVRLPEEYAKLCRTVALPPPVAAPAPVRPATEEAVSAGFRGLSVLLVEDQLLIAMEVEDALRAGGASDVFTAPSHSAALSALEAMMPDAAVLDVNLGDQTSAELAAVLRERRIPFLFSTGYIDRTMIPPEFHDVPVVRKPCAPEDVVRALHKRMNDAAA